MDFYAVANTPVDNSVTTKAVLVSLIENSPAAYNGTFADVSSKSLRSGEFLMSGNVTKAIAQAGSTTQVALTLRRNVAKVAVQTSMDASFASKYPGTVRITSAKIAKAASQTPYFGGTAKPGTMNYTHTQTPAVVSGKYNNLFYLFENGALASGNRVLLTLDGIYDRDGDTATTSDQTPVSYEVELSGVSGNGQLLRNGYYRIAVSLAGLTGQDVSANISVAAWETPVTQTISIGK